MEDNNAKKPNPTPLYRASVGRPIVKRVNVDPGAPNASHP